MNLSVKLERFKSILLVLLVISSIVLTVNKWFDEKLWPEGYNFFSHVKNGFATEGNDTDIFSPNEEVLKPAKIIVNNSGNHNLYTKSSDEYQSITNEIKSLLTKYVSSEDGVVVSEQEWNDCLKAKSCYFSYPVIYDYGFLKSQLLNKYTIDTKYCKEFIISLDSRVSSVLYIYSKDAVTNEISKKSISHDSTKIKSLIENVSENENNFYSYELKFDMQTDGSVNQPIIIDSDVLISVTPKKLPAIKETNVFNNINTNQNMQSDVLSAFGFNTSSIRRYVESDNSMVFVENYATLKLGSDGLLDYKSIENSMGIKIDGNSSYESINSCITFVNTLNSKLFSGKEMYYEISSDVCDINSKTYTLKFDYYIHDNMIVVPKDSYPIDHSVIVEVVSGKIVSYKQICKEYSLSGDYIDFSSAIEAIDVLYSSHQTGELITDIFTAYNYDLSQKKWSPSWYIEKSDGVISHIPLGGGGGGL